jgi:hypothetical protein
MSSLFGCETKTLKELQDYVRELNKTAVEVHNVGIRVIYYDRETEILFYGKVVEQNRSEGYCLIQIYKGTIVKTTETRMTTTCDWTKPLPKFLRVAPIELHRSPVDQTWIHPLVPVAEDE